MKSRTIKVKLGEIDNVLGTIQELKDSLNARVEELVNRLSELVGTSVKATLAPLSSIDPDNASGWNLEAPRYTYGQNGNVNGAVISLSGDKVLFIEFGAGNLHSEPQNPKAAELGYGPGTYPGQHHVPNPGYWWYRDRTGEMQYSEGNQPYMPMYRASEELLNSITQIVGEIFK